MSKDETSRVVFGALDTIQIVEFVHCLVGHAGNLY